MARGTPKRTRREPREGSAFPSQALARNIRAYRALRELKQADLADRMSELGHEWSAGIVGFVERESRSVTIDEMAGLAICLETPLGALIDPTGPDGRAKLALDLGAPASTEEWLIAHHFAYGRMIGRLVPPNEHVDHTQIAFDINPEFKDDKETR